MKLYKDLWAKLLRHRKSHKRPGRFCAKCVALLELLEAAAKREDGEGE